MSIALTLGPLRRCRPMRNRKIPPFPLGLLDAFPVNVSAVDTGPRGSCATARRPPPRSVPSGTLRGAILGPVAGGAADSNPVTFPGGLLHRSRDPLAAGRPCCTTAPLPGVPPPGGLAGERQT